MTDPAETAPSFLEFRDDDVVILRINAPSGRTRTIEHLRRRAEQGPYYLAADFRGMTGRFDKEMHEAGPRLVEPEWFLGVAYVGASMPLRMMLKVFNLGLFLAGKSDFPTGYVDTEEEALALFERFRSERRARG